MRMSKLYMPNRITHEHSAVHEILSSALPPTKHIRGGWGDHMERRVVGQGCYPQW